MNISSCKCIFQMGAKGSCAKTLLSTPFGSLACDACGSSCVKEVEQESLDDLEQRAVKDHTMKIIMRLLDSESAQVKNNFASIVRELIEAGADPESIHVRHEVLSPQPGIQRLRTTIVHGDTTSENSPLRNNNSPPTLQRVEETKEVDHNTPPPPDPPILKRQNAIYIQDELAK